MRYMNRMVGVFQRPEAMAPSSTAWNCSCGGETERAADTGAGGQSQCTAHNTSRGQWVGVLRRCSATAAAASSCTVGKECVGRGGGGKGRGGRW